MKKIFNIILSGLIALSFSVATHAANDGEKADYKATIDRNSTVYDAARANCNSFSGNQKDVCIAEAKATRQRNDAYAKSKYENTPKAQMNARKEIAEANYSVAKEKCEAQSGNAKDLCKREAKTTYEKAVVDAKSFKEISDIKSDARDDKLESDYKVAVERCDSLSGDAKDRCVSAAKTSYGK